MDQYARGEDSLEAVLEWGLLLCRWPTVLKVPFDSAFTPNPPPTFQRGRGGNKGDTIPPVVTPEEVAIPSFKAAVRGACPSNPRIESGERRNRYPVRFKRDITQTRS